MFDETLGGALRVIAIARSNIRATHPEFTGNPVEAVAARRRNHPAPDIAQRNTERHRRPVRRRLADHFADGAVDGRLGGSAETGEPATRNLLGQPAGQFGPDPVAAEDRPPATNRRADRRRVSRIMSSMLGTQLRIETRCWRISSTHAAAVGPLLVIDRDRLPRPPRTCRRCRRPTASNSRADNASARSPFPDVEPFVHRVDGVHRRAVRNVHTLGQTRRTRGEEHVGDRAGLGKHRRRQRFWMVACRIDGKAGDVGA